MPSVSSEIIEEIANHISRCGGEFAEWCVAGAGLAFDVCAPKALRVQSIADPKGLRQSEYEG
jgi:hypothetical protein